MTTRWAVPSPSITTPVVLYDPRYLGSIDVFHGYATA